MIEQRSRRSYDLLGQASGKEVVGEAAYYILVAGIVVWLIWRRHIAEAPWVAMHKRVVLLSGLLMFALGAGAMAQSPSPEASPEATPLYAPDDLASTIPRQVGSCDLYVRVGPPNAEGLGDPEDQAVWRDFLEAWGKVPSDLVDAYGAATDSDDEPGLALWAIRVPGIPAEELIEPTLLASDIDLSAIPPGGHADWRDIDGRSVLVLGPDDTDTW